MSTVPAVTVESRSQSTRPRMATGAFAHGDFRCANCGYGVSMYRSLPHCPMCGGKVWLRAGRVGSASKASEESPRFRHAPALAP